MLLESERRSDEGRWATIPKRAQCVRIHRLAGQSGHDWHNHTMTRERSVPALSYLVELWERQCLIAHGPSAPILRYVAKGAYLLYVYNSDKLRLTSS
jgi:hypothetical protein